jgi:predicted GNAT family acetyltransferase
MNEDVVHNTAIGRFQITVDDIVAVLDYSLSGQTITFVHTGVPAELEGRGIGSRLARAGLEYAVRESLHVVPRCPFIRAYIARHPEFRGLVR